MGGTDGFVPSNLVHRRVKEKEKGKKKKWGKDG